jgi:hypothetical protein
MKRKYKVEIVSAHHKNGIWYTKKRGDVYEVEIGIVNNRAVFVVDRLHYISPLDCIILEQWLEPPYVK